MNRDKTQNRRYEMYLGISATLGKADLARFAIGVKAASRAMRLAKVESIAAMLLFPAFLRGSEKLREKFRFCSKG